MKWVKNRPAGVGPCKEPTMFCNEFISKVHILTQAHRLEFHSVQDGRKDCALIYFHVGKCQMKIKTFKMLHFLTCKLQLDFAMPDRMIKALLAVKIFLGET